MLLRALVGLAVNRKLVLIEWLDSKGITAEWEHLDELESLEPSRCVSVGFLMEETEQYKTIVQSTNEAQVLGRLTIPCGAIQELVELVIPSKH